MPDDRTLDDLGYETYQAYGDAVAGTNHAGNRMPAWDKLPVVIRDAWIEAAIAARSF